MGYFFYIILAVIFLGLNAVFNGAETGLVTLDVDYLKFLNRSNRANVWERRLLKFASSPESFLAVTLLGINSCLVIATSLITVLLEKIGPIALQAGTIITSLFIFLVCEFLPKMKFSDRPLKYCVKFLPVLVWAEFIFYFPVKIVNKVTRVVMRVLKISFDEKDGKISREELLILLSHAMRTGTLEENPSEMARSIIALKDTCIRVIIIPRTQMLALDQNTDIDKARKIVIQSGFSRIPVFDGEIEKIVGVLYFKDLFLKQIDSIKEILLEPLFVPEMKPAIELFREMREKAVQVAIVVDEYATVCGIVTFEDLVEQVVGKIHDEFDKFETNFRKNDDGSLTVRADIGLHELKESGGPSFIAVNGVSTINGLIQAITGKIPCEKESFLIEGFNFRVLESDERQVKWVKISSNRDKK
jgi:putative hemolysin